MDYATNYTFLLLEGHIQLEKYRYFYFVIALAVYILIICFNAVVIFIIYSDKLLHESMYIFIAALLFNSLFGATVLYPKLLSDLLSERQVTYYHACMFQAFCIYAYAVSEFTLLSAMAYDRYVSICKPLQYVTLVKMYTVKKLLFLCWFLPCCELGVGALLTSQLHLCKFTLNRIYCDNFSVVKLSCGNTSLNNLYGLFILIIAIFPPMIFIIYSYIRILAICLGNSKDFRRKALQTCLPHLIIFINFSVNACFEVINNRLESNIPHIVSMIMSVEYLIIPPLFNPIIYGWKTQEIFKRIKILISWKKRKHVSF
ncbi:olfactory receptor 52K1-like [Pygocentrus nattereri]|uniref:Olfactory receptor n=1 Tax=Pygocentrus nattereri TaxID=42514 RepID=A0AAR2LJK1_PYGNA|nr:olfactory receptor 52K1-like [Pygocentrus nattereri]